MSKITTHILDTARGCPAEGVGVVLYREEGHGPAGGDPAAGIEIARGVTNKDGRIAEWGASEAGVDAAPGEALVKGIYKIRFGTKDYFDRQSVRTFYPFVEI